jgi:hypothetical protein
VRYRYDPEKRKRYTTVELIVAEGDWTPRERAPRASRPPEEMVYVRVAWDEVGLQARLKTLGAIWRPRLRLWELPWGAVRALEIEDRVVGR